MVGLEAPSGQELPLSSPAMSAPSDAPHLEVNVLAAGFVLAVLLYIVGSIMESAENAKREREWKKRWHP